MKRRSARRQGGESRIPRAVLTMLLVATGLLVSGPASRAQSETVSMAVKDAEISIVAESFARLAGSRLVIDPAVGGKVTLKVRNVGWMTALDAACESVGCRWQLRGGDDPILELLAREPIESPTALQAPISIDLEGASIVDVLASFGKISGHEVEIDPGLDSKVTLGIQNVSVGTALRAVCESAGCTWTEEDGTLRFRLSETESR